MATASAARKAAYAVLLAVERGQAHSDDLLRGKAVRALSMADRNLATALVLGVLRWQIRLDRQLQVLLTRPNAKLDAEVRVALRMGALQLLHMDRIPARAAIDESVELAKQAGHRFAAGMVNAVLRKLAVAPATKFPEETAEELALAEAHPAWMVERWARSYGMEAARAICRHGQTQPALAVRLAEDAVAAELAAEGVRLEPGVLLRGARVVAEGDVTRTVAFREGRARIQDEGSQLVAELAGHGSAILDCCAAPGGKTLVLAERNPLARLVACEWSAQRVAQLRERLAGLGERVECRQADASALAERDTFDVVLADVPCSGTGTLGRNPEIRHRLRAEELARQAERQRAILRAALDAASAGGRVVYSTCSLEPEENEQVVAAVLAERPEVRVAAMRECLDALRCEGAMGDDAAERLLACVTPEGFLRLLPGVFGTDGFFIAVLERGGGAA